MTSGQRLRHALSAPLRSFFDRRFGALRTELGGDIGRSRDDLTRTIDRRADELIAPVRVTTEELRAHVAALSETMTYLGAELERLTVAIERSQAPPAERRGDD